MLEIRHVGSVILAVVLLQVAGGLLGAIVPLRLESLGSSDVMIGLVVGIYSAGFMLGAWFTPSILTNIGNIRAFSAGAGVTAAGTLLLGLVPDIFVWSAIRFVQGFGLAVMFTSAESWMADQTPANKRGNVLGAYHVFAKVALLAGPFLAIGHGVEALHPYLWGGVFLALALLPVCVTRRTQPEAPSNDPFPLSKLFKLTPTAVIGVFIAGVSNTSVLALLPIYASSVSDMDPTTATALLLGATWVGGIISQWPAGAISDRIDRRLVVMGLGAMAAGASVGMAMFGDVLPWMGLIVLLGVWGAGALSFYGVCVAHAADRADQSQMARMMSGLLFVWAVGSVVGPILFGIVMESFLGKAGLFWFEALFCISLMITMVWRRGVKQAPTEEEREPFEPVMPNILPASDLDPRNQIPD